MINDHTCQIDDDDHLDEAKEDNVCGLGLGNDQDDEEDCVYGFMHGDDQDDDNDEDDKRIVGTSMGMIMMMMMTMIRRIRGLCVWVGGWGHLMSLVEQEPPGRFI